MRVQHTPHTLSAFPVYSSTFLSPTQLVLGGGGGSSRSGIKNRLRLYNVAKDRSLDLIDEFVFAGGEDAPMSMDSDHKSSTFVCGANSSLEQLKSGLNQNCRAFTVKDLKITALGAQSTLSAEDLDDYQKVTVLSPDSKLLAVAGARVLHLLSYPSLAPVAPPVETQHEIYDATFSSNELVVATTEQLLVYSLPTKTSSSPSKKRKGKKKTPLKSQSLPTLELLKTIGIPSNLAGTTGAVFRCARFHPSNHKILYTASNSLPDRRQKSKNVNRQASICKWDTDSWETINIKKVGDKGLTCFAISPNGTYIACGSSDLKVSLWDSNTLAPVASILNAHEFPPTTIAFNPSSDILVTGSPDTVRIISLPLTTGGSTWPFILLFVVTLLIILLGVAIQKYLSAKL